MTGGIIRWCLAFSRIKSTCKQEEKCPPTGHPKLFGLFAILRGRRRALPEKENLLNRANRSVSINFMIHMKGTLIFWLLLSSHEALRPQPNHNYLQAHGKLRACKTAELPPSQDLSLSKNMMNFYFRKHILLFTWDFKLMLSFQKKMGLFQIFNFSRKNGIYSWPAGQTHTHTHTQHFMILLRKPISKS